jgi:tryptophan-rich sensory protein
VSLPGSRAGSTPRRAILVAAGVALLVAALGATVTDLGPWYGRLAKPSWQPPGPAFGIIWTVIYALCALSGATAWRRASAKGRREWILGLFALNGFLNLLWSLLFFQLKRPDWALSEAPLLVLSVALLMIFLWRFARPSSLMLAPYLVWVCIATALNVEIVKLNPPF